MTAIEIIRHLLARRRLVYHFFSGLMFLVLSAFLFFHTGRLTSYFNVRLFSILLFGYAAYRFIVFAWLYRKSLQPPADRAASDRGNRSDPDSISS